MKSFVLMSKRTGHLLEGYRVLLMDGPLKFPSTKDGLVLVHVASEPDGWIVSSTEAGGFKGMDESRLGGKRVHKSRRDLIAIYTTRLAPSLFPATLLPCETSCV